MRHRSGPRARRTSSRSHRATWLRPLAAWLLIALCPTAVIACSQDKPPENPLEYQQNAKRAYDEAMEAFYDGDWELVPELMNEVRRDYGATRYARLAELRIADAKFHQEAYAEAVTGYKSFVHDYPNDPEVPYARYKIALTQFRSSGESLLLPPLEERDLSSVQDAHESLEAFLSDYPEDARRVEITYMLQVVRGMLVRHELYVARYYADRDNFPAAAARCEYALATYADSGLEAEALVLLGETYMKMKEPTKARAVLNQVLRRHGDTPFVVPAERFLAQLGEPIRTKRIGHAESSSRAETKRAEAPLPSDRRPAGQ